jgi:hypothetical protein
MDDNTLAELLLKKGLVTDKQLSKARELADTLGEKGNLGKIVVRLGYMTERQLREITKEDKQRSVDVLTAKVDFSAMTRIPEQFLKQNVVIPLKHDMAGKILLAMTGSTDFGVIENVQFMTDSLVDPIVAEKEKILQRLDELFTVSKSGRQKVIDIARGEDAVLNEPAPVLIKALSDLLIEKGIITRAELYKKTKLHK